MVKCGNEIKAQQARERNRVSEDEKVEHVNSVNTSKCPWAGPLSEHRNHQGVCTYKLRDCPNSGCRKLQLVLNSKANNDVNYLLKYI